MALMMMAKMLAMPGAACCFEILAKHHLPQALTKKGSLGVCKLFGAVIAVNVVGSTFTLITLGMSVGSARKKYAEIARKKDDADAEDRFSYPTLYAEGPSIEAKAFNCVQRGHY